MRTRVTDRVDIGGEARIGSDLELRLSELPNPKTTDDAVKAPWKLVAPKSIASAARIRSRL